MKLQLFRIPSRHVISYGYPLRMSDYATDKKNPSDSLHQHPFCTPLELCHVQNIFPFF